MKKFLIAILFCTVLLTACSMQLPGEKKEETGTGTETLLEVTLDASTVSSQDIIIDADSVISINNIEDGDFIVLSNPEFVKKSDKVRSVSRSPKQKEGTLLKSDNNTFIPYPDGTSNSAVFFGEDLGVSDDEVVKVHAKKLKKISTADWITADMNPQEGVNFCTKKTETMELYEGIIAIDLRSFSGNAKKYDSLASEMMLSIG